MGKNNASARHISEVGNYGDKREYYASKYLMEHAPPNDPVACIRSLEEFDVRWTMLHLGQEKGDYLDGAIRALISEKRRGKKRNSRHQPIQHSDGATESGAGTTCCPNTEALSEHPTPIHALEIGAYIGYSAIRIGRLLAAEADPGSTLLSVEQNEDNSRYAAAHVNHAGLNKTVTVLHSKIEECFKNGEKDETDGEGIAINAGYRENFSCRVPYDFVFLDHRKPFYLRDLKLLESRGVIDASVTTLVADNVAPLEHLRNRAQAIARGKRNGPCKCVNKACDFLDYVRQKWSSTEIFYGENTKDGISISKPASKSNIDVVQ
ncbi:unnamed protein product [Pseudo-nitzschia multistriata]|uniref:Catechol O-methyltransferase n=1 Tax=Pseudo-nitzschia multistriata TaxID=183589 RepID=A0A448Z5C2_9STRA|nr:unnamed protein product [Pseudo-nitzschia multistriata]